MSINCEDYLACQLKPVNSTRVLEISCKYSYVPVDYLEFLLKCGHGNLGRIYIYDGPVLVGEIYDQQHDGVDICVFGDDGQGYCYGFSIHCQGCIVEFGPMGAERRVLKRSFEEFINGKSGNVRQ